jgi:L-arabinonolactonase
MAYVTCALECGNLLGEGPVWDSVENTLYWVDVPMPNPTLHRFIPESGKHDQWRLPEMGTSLAVRESGGLLIAMQSRLCHFDLETGLTTPVLSPEPDLPNNRTNDGKCDRSGRFWFGTMQNNVGANGEDMPIDERSGSLYCYQADGTCKKWDTGFGVSNTFAWSPDNKTMYFGDTFDAIYAYDYDGETGEVGNRRDFAKFEGPGYGDGSTIDEEGFLWNCRWDGGCVLRIAPDGSLDRKVDLPVQRPTSCTFGGTNLDVLYVTCARFGFTEDELGQQPWAGGILAVDTGVRGVPEPRFAG